MYYIYHVVAYKILRYYIYFEGVFNTQNTLLITALGAWYSRE